jgi:hypothetical protein
MSNLDTKAVGIERAAQAAFARSSSIFYINTEEKASLLNSLALSRPYGDDLSDYDQGKYDGLTAAMDAVSAIESFDLPTLAEWREIMRGVAWKQNKRSDSPQPFE